MYIYMNMYTALRSVYVCLRLNASLSIAVYLFVFACACLSAPNANSGSERGSARARDLPSIYTFYLPPRPRTTHSN